MRDLAGKRYWLIGASEGLGRALVDDLDAAGASLVLSARNQTRILEIASGMRDAEVVPVDVTDPKSVSKAARSVGEIDGVIYCVGAYEPMKATEWSADAATLMAEVNFVGALHVLGQVVPAFVKKNAGHIVLIGSLSGFRGLPGAIGYGASKAALMHLAENLRIDLRETDIDVQVVNPGFIRTRLSGKNDFAMPQIMEPEDAAARVIKAMKGRRFSTSFPAPFSWLFTLGRYLPLGLFHRIF
ncbi:SDR family NAD(P)-dependent oxidoreductase [Sinisalibacter lacisalsi]|uniref:Short-chain dehydrogenase n=1 Tax=Sinisalibacter lacisalsi TaxID=1526570 RepID=A0ABQ1QCP5_9RHOB|nr:SDR family NAD(P)-dependent oxidoreductase [Sinisalibacter lacisalsi]GGD22245.1 short-chain dehydrogenase [Sinisalibacter lacisalsi]